MGTFEAPFRVCCGQQHLGAACPDGLVMCCICFNRVAKDRLHVLEGGNGASVLYEDVCITCKNRESCA